MASRLNNLLNHIAIRETDGDEMRAVKQRLALATLANQFTMHDEKLKMLVMYMIHEMEEGLAGRPSTMRMLPSYVYKSNPNNATGAFYALDLGGTNFRVLRVVLRNGKVEDRMDSKYVIPQAALTGTSNDLFGFIAHSLKKLMVERAPQDLNTVVPLGFTFSFGVVQRNIKSGVLVKWNKGFSTKGVEGRDVVELLQASLKRENVKVNVVALCNDTVGTLVARYFEDKNAQVGAIIGTGSNACYFDRCSAVTKDPSVAARGDVLTPINMESGNFDSKYKYVLPITAYDDGMDAITPNPNEQRHEKMLSGLYLGEITRRVLVHVAQIGCLPHELIDGLSKPWAFESRHMGMITADQTPGLPFTRALVAKLSGVEIRAVADLHVIREVCCLVRNRAAQQSAVFCSAPILKTHTQGLATVAVDGSVVEKAPSFRRICQECITRILGPTSNVRVRMQKDGSGIGAAMICALVVLQEQQQE